MPHNDNMGIEVSADKLDGTASQVNTQSSNFPTDMLIDPEAFIRHLHGEQEGAAKVDFRYIDGGGIKARFYRSYYGSLDVYLSPDHNIYFGVLLRKDANHWDLKPSPLFYSDCDIKDAHGYLPDGVQVLEMSPEELRRYNQKLYADVMSKLKDMSIEPIAVVYTGHGLQLYFLANRLLDARETRAVNRALHKLLERFGADPRSTDASRILRLPGSFNVKNPERPIKVEVWLLN